jgi:hypothetical protein
MPPCEKVNLCIVYKRVDLEITFNNYFTILFKSKLFESYIYIYIYICVCVCVFMKTFKPKTEFIQIKIV